MSERPVKCVECGITWPSHADFLNHLAAIERHADIVCRCGHPESLHYRTSPENERRCAECQQIEPTVPLGANSRPTTANRSEI